jgi:hypothetical protein
MLTLSSLGLVGMVVTFVTMMTLLALMSFTTQGGAMSKVILLQSPLIGSSVPEAPEAAFRREAQHLVETDDESPSYRERRRELIYKGDRTKPEDYPFGAIICSPVHSNKQRRQSRAIEAESYSADGEEEEEVCQPLCTGSLISPGVVLTAAHCFNEFPQIYEYDNDFTIGGREDLEKKLVRSYRVLFGKDTSGPHSVAASIGIKKIVVGEPFVFAKGSAIWDVALVFLEDCKHEVEPIKMLTTSQAASTSSTSTEEQKKELAFPSSVSVIGWGDSETSCVTPFLTEDRYDPMQVMSYDVVDCDADAVCQRNPARCDKSLMMCMSQMGVSSCTGDSGGPLFIELVPSLAGGGETQSQSRSEDDDTEIEKLRNYNAYRIKRQQHRKEETNNNNSDDIVHWTSLLPTILSNASSKPRMPPPIPPLDKNKSSSQEKETHYHQQQHTIARHGSSAAILGHVTAGGEVIHLDDNTKRESYSHWKDLIQESWQQQGPPDDNSKPFEWIELVGNEKKLHHANSSTSAGSPVTLKKEEEDSITHNNQSGETPGGGGFDWTGVMVTLNTRIPERQQQGKEEEEEEEQTNLLQEETNNTSPIEVDATMLDLDTIASQPVVVKHQRPRFVQVGILSGGEILSTAYSKFEDEMRPFVVDKDRFMDHATGALLPAYTDWLRKHLETDACLENSQLSLVDLFFDLSDL